MTADIVKTVRWFFQDFVLRLPAAPFTLRSGKERQFPLRLYLCPGDGGPFFLWARRGRRIWPWVLALAVCLGLFRLLCIDINATNNLLALVTGYHNNESTAFHLLYLRVCYSGMLFGVALAAIVAWFLRKINS